MMRMIEIGEAEEVIFPDQAEVETPIPVVIPETVPVEAPWSDRSLRGLTWQEFAVRSYLPG